MPKTELSDDLARRFAATSQQLDRLDRERQPWELIRDQLIAEAKTTGASARTIAAAAGVSHTYVAQLQLDELDELEATAEAARLLVVDVPRAELTDEQQRAVLAIAHSTGCGCTEPGFAIIGDYCPACSHPAGEHDQKGCHAS